MARPYGQVKPRIDPAARRVVEIGNWITPNAQPDTPDLYKLRWERNDGSAVAREWRTAEGDNSGNLASPFASGVVRVWITGVNYSTSATPEPGSTYYRSGEYTDESVASDWTQLGTPPSPVATVTMPRADLERDVAELEASLAYRLGWGRVVRPTKRLRARLG